MSFWVKYDDKRSIIDNRGLIAFIGDYERHYFDSYAKETDTEYADGSTHLSLSTLFNIEYQESFFNSYRRTFDIELDRRTGDPTYDFWRLNYDKNNVRTYQFLIQCTEVTNHGTILSFRLLMKKSMYI